MGLAFHQLYGVENGFKGIEFSGRTDRFLLAQALRQHGIEGEYEEHEERFLEAYFALLPGKLRERDGRLMPGFPELLEALREARGARVGLATGNFSGSARLKLEHFGIHGYFEGGGFGEESEDRAAVVRRALDLLADGLDASDVFVIGDTPHDITAAKANGAVAVGVATGGNSVDELRKCGADIVFGDFADWRDAASRLTGGA
jgi:phosphoglycolate phosphatase-like HAD superfamily hydrolase